MAVLSRIPADWPYRDLSREIICPPHRWHVQTGGTGPQVLLIHGAGGATHSWRALMPFLLPQFSVIAPDLPGQGFSTLGRRDRAGLDPMAEDLKRLCAQEGWQPEAIIGHSAGAPIALRLAEILPHRPKAVIGINPALGTFEGVAGWLFPMMAKLLSLNPLVPRLFARLSGGEARVRTLLASTGSQLDETGVAFYRRLVSDPGHVDGTLSMMAQWSLDGLMARLPALDLPVLFVTGDNDRAVPPVTAPKQAARMRDARVVTIPGTGHLVHEEAAEAVARVILPFLARHLGPSDPTTRATGAAPSEAREE